MENFNRGSEAICRSPIDVLLNQCLNLLKGLYFDQVTGCLDSSAAIQKNPFANSVVVHGEVVLDWSNPDMGESWAGRTDYAIGIEHPSARAEHCPITSDGTLRKKTRHPYRAYLLVIEAKRRNDRYRTTIWIYSCFA